MACVLQRKLYLSVRIRRCVATELIDLFHSIALAYSPGKELLIWQRDRATRCASRKPVNCCTPVRAEIPFKRLAMCEFPPVSLESGPAVRLVHGISLPSSYCWSALCSHKQWRSNAVGSDGKVEGPRVQRPSSSRPKNKSNFSVTVKIRTSPRG